MTRCLGPFSSSPASISWSITYFVNYTRPEPAHHCSLGSISMSSTFIVVVVYFFILFCCHLLLSHGIFNFFLIFISNWWYPHTPSHGYGFGRGTNIGIRTRTPPYPSQIPARVCIPLAFTSDPERNGTELRYTPEGGNAGNGWTKGDGRTDGRTDGGWNV